MSRSLSSFSRCLVGASVLAIGSFSPATSGAVIGIDATYSHGPLLRWAQNGHYYQYVESTLPRYWEDFRAYAETLSLKGVVGHLATVTSQAENDFVFSIIPWTTADEQVALGGLQTPDTSDPTANWTWITGEHWEFENWAPGEPNNDRGFSETALTMYTRPKPMELWGTWNDARRDAGVVRYSLIVEFIPEPASLSILALGGLALFRRRAS